MPIQRKYCPTCSKRAIVSATNSIAGLNYETYSCGHTNVRRDFKSSDFSYFKSQDGKQLYPFQCIGAEFALQSNVRYLIADEMGLGKTPQSLAPIAAEPKELAPSLVICKATPQIQWAREIMRWLGNDYCPQIINKENEFILPGIKCFIISYDTLWRFKDIEGFIQKLKIKYIIMDEVQHIKNTGSKRTNGVRRACSQVEHIGALSGTPIENDPIEFFPILNILYPTRFVSESSFSMKWINSYFNGYKNKSMGMRDIQAWQSYTRDFIIRRTRAEVLPDLPAISREYRFCELSGSIEDAYEETMGQFTKYYDANSANLNYSYILAYMVKMRHLTGVAKINPTIDFITDFLEETDRKIILFLHHKDVAGVMHEKLTELCLSNPDKYGLGVRQIASETKDRQGEIDKFKNENYRILEASTLAAGEALNIQFCQDCIMMERMWNPSKEEQAEGRIVRIGQTGSKLTATYMQVINTIDDDLGKLVEKKRAMKANVLDGKEIDWNESSLIQELAEILASKRGVKVS